MVGAPGYSSGRSVLVLCPTSPVSPDVLSSVWEEFELNGVLVTFASDTGKIALAVQNIDFSDSSQQLKGVPQPRSQSGAVIDGSLKTRAEVRAAQKLSATYIVVSQSGNNASCACDAGNISSRTTSAQLSLKLYCYYRRTTIITVATILCLYTALASAKLVHRTAVYSSN